jgi:hypothetical protein
MSACVCVCACARGPMRHTPSVDQITPLHVKERKTCAPNNTRATQARAPRSRALAHLAGEMRQRMCGCWNLTFLQKNVRFCSVSGHIFWARCGSTLPLLFALFLSSLSPSLSSPCLSLSSLSPSRVTLHPAACMGVSAFMISTHLCHTRTS